MAIDDQHDLVTALFQLLHAADAIMKAPAELLHSVVVARPDFGQMDLPRAADFVAYDLAVAQQKVNSYRKGPNVKPQQLGGPRA